MKLNSKVIPASEGEFQEIVFRKNSLKTTLLSCTDNVEAVIQGAAMMNSNLMILEGHSIVMRKDHLSIGNKVKLVTGGKIGHEPLFLSYVAPGMLTAAVVGTKHSAPSAKDVYTCFKELSDNHSAGIIAIVPNSFEEVINFGLGIERARCDNILVDMVTIGDDCWESGKTHFGRRCLAGITLAFKIAGALAESSLDMKEIYVTLRKLCMGTISCHLMNSNAFIGTDLEAGTGKFMDSNNFCKVISEMLDYLVDPKKYFSLRRTDQSSFLLMVNSYTNERLFLYACVKEILEQLQFREINVIRVYAGTFVSGERGFSITLLKNTDERLVFLADSACGCHFWPRTTAKGVPLVVKGPRLPPGPAPLEPMGPYVSNTDFIDIPILFVCEALLSSKEVFNKIDVNNRFGNTISPFLDVLLKKCYANELNHERPCNMFSIMSYLCQDFIGDINGTIFYIFFTGAAQAFLTYSREIPVQPHMWVESLERGVDSVKAYTQFRETDFTSLDVIAPFATTISHYLSNGDNDWVGILQDSLTVAKQLLDGTQNIDSPKKKPGQPEVSGQATLVALTAIVEGIRFVFNSVGTSTNEN